MPASTVPLSMTGCAPYRRSPAPSRRRTRSTSPCSAIGFVPSAPRRSAALKLCWTIPRLRPPSPCALLWRSSPGPSRPARVGFCPSPSTPSRRPGPRHSRSQAAQKTEDMLVRWPRSRLIGTLSATTRSGSGTAPQRPRPTKSDRIRRQFPFPEKRALTVRPRPRATLPAPAVVARNIKDVAAPPLPRSSTYPDRPDSGQRVATEYPKPGPGGPPATPGNHLRSPGASVEKDKNPASHPVPAVGRSSCEDFLPGTSVAPRLMV